MKNCYKFIILTFLTACANVSEEADNRDPWEGLNRSIFAFNEVVDGIVVRPVAQIYRGIVPEYGQDRVHNVVSNLRQPVNFVNSVLQGDPQNAFSSLWSFVLNSTLGVGGVFDFAGTNTSLRVRNEDFGQTLGKWGVGSGNYVVLPIFGPSSTRDAFGRLTDVFTDPFNYMNRDVVVTRAVISAIDTRAGNIDLLDDIYDTSLDPYATIRSGYLQKREASVKNTHSSDAEAEE